MKNPKFWRKRSVEDIRKRLENLKASIVYQRIISIPNENHSIELAHRLLKKMGLPIKPTPRKRVRRLARKVRSMERTEKLE